MIYIRGNEAYGDSWAPYVPDRASTMGVVVMVGQSNGNGTVVDPDYGSTAIAAAHPTLTPTVVQLGSQLVSYDTAVGPMPYLIEHMGGETSSPVLINRCINGQGEVSVRQVQIPGAVADLVALGLTPADVNGLWLVHGEEDNTTEVLANAYKNRALERIVRSAEGTFPNAWVGISLLRSTTYGGAFYAPVREAQVAAAGRRGNRFLVDTVNPTPIPLQDSVHYTPGYGGGYNISADRFWAGAGGS